MYGEEPNALRNLGEDEEIDEDYRKELLDNQKKLLEKNKMKMLLAFKFPVKNYVATLVMKNPDMSDLRIYEINVTIHPQVFKATIELKTPARIPVEQNIPVSNGSNNEAKIKVQFIPAPGENVFS